MLKINIIIKESSQRLDKFLTVQPGLAGYSRAYLQCLIKKGDILINGKIVKPSYKLKLNDTISGQIEPLANISLQPNPNIKLNIIYEDNDILVVDKPAGLTVHPSEFGNSDRQDTLVSALLAYLPDIKNVGENPLRPGLVHRLDKDTSGLMIIAKNNEAFSFFKKQFSSPAKNYNKSAEDYSEGGQERRITKKYIALVSGCPKQEQGIIEAPIARSLRNPTKQKISFESKARKAITEYKVIKKISEKYCLIEAIPKTGRMHQIRIHFAYLGHPIVGDTKYGGPKLPSLRRHFLHATYLKFKLPNGKNIELNSPLPTDLQKILTALDKKSEN